MRAFQYCRVGLGKMRLLMVVGALSILLTACAPTMVKQDDASGVLKGVKEVSVRFAADPARTGVAFNTKGYTIIGAAYVAAAVSKMNSQSEEMHNSYVEYLKTHPNVSSLQDTFNRELEANLLAQGFNIRKFSATRKISEKKEISYDVGPDQIKTKWAVVVDGLNVQYFAPSSTDDYNPRSTAYVTVMNSDDLAAKPMRLNVLDDAKVRDPGSFSYKDYESLSKDTGKAYEGLEQSVKRLAKQVAESLIESRIQ